MPESGCLLPLPALPLRLRLYCRYTTSIASSHLIIKDVFQKYLSDHTKLPLPSATELGASIALQYAVEVGSVQSRCGKYSHYSADP